MPEQAGSDLLYRTSLRFAWSVQYHTVLLLALIHARVESNLLVVCLLLHHGYRLANLGLGIQYTMEGRGEVFPSSSERARRTKERGRKYSGEWVGSSASLASWGVAWS